MVSGRVFICYYGSWAVYRPGDGKFDVEQIDPTLCTHLVYAFAGVGQDNKIKVLDPWNEIVDSSGSGKGLKIRSEKMELVILLLSAFFSIMVEKQAMVSGKVIVCYYGSWAVYRPGDGKFDVEQIDPTFCTHLVYAFAGVGQDNKIKVLDPWNEIVDSSGSGKDAFRRFNALKSKSPGLKTLLAVGGWNEGSTSFSQMSADAGRRATFVASCVDLLKQYGFDGLDMDWEYPANRGGSAADKGNFVQLLRDLKAAFRPYGFLLTAAVSAGKNTIDTAYDVPGMSQ
ncbi:unnamed protein product [Darwinula stevensoni]|uniref:GH18 domain-containing protein n=1 Tax=Darwinula stevensoni TaxID=69355 RepID=A0A7R9FRW5_9CRUS|nr:unnamed protein product [Darwinula stevensoni]CAG0902228.1 unnamed protein product [Darwinula stevensoni]